MRLLTRSCLDWKKYCQYSMLTFWPAVAGAVWAVAWLAGAAAAVVGAAAAAGAVVGWAGGADVGAGAAAGWAVEPAAQADSSPAAAAPNVNCNRWRRLNWFISLVYLPGGTNGPRYPQKSGAGPRRADS